MKVLRLIVPSSITYAVQCLSHAAGVKFDDRQIVDVPLRTQEQINAGRSIQSGFQCCGLGVELRNGPNAVTIYSAEVVDV